VTSEGLFSVFIERARSEAPDAAAQLARAMASHYGIDAAAVEQRLAVGRFRVKGAVDRATADSFAADLTKLGAIVKVERAEEVTPPPPAGPGAAASAAGAAGKAKRNRTPPTGVKIPTPVSLQQPRVAVPAAKVPAIAPVGTPRPQPVVAPKPAAAPVRAPTPAPVRAPTPAPVRAPTPPPVAAPAPEPSRPSQPQFTSGLAAAKKSDVDPMGGLGALGGDMPLSLSTLDGEDDHELSASRNVGLSASFGPPPDTARGRVAAPAAPARATASSQMAIVDPSDEVDVAMDDDDAGAGDPIWDLSDDISLDTSMLDDRSSMPASIGPAAGARDLGGSLPASIGPAAGARDLGGPAAMFAPPDAGDDIPLALEVEVRKKPANAPPPSMASDPHSAHDSHGGHGGHGAVASERSSTQQPQVTRAPGESAFKTYGKDERVRFVAGVVVAAALGCVPALVLHSVRERSAFADLDTRLHQQQAQVLTTGDWDNLDRVRASYIEKKKAERTSIAVTSMLLWVAVSGAVAFVWFRKVDWDRIFQ
jgi:hypothetical protein